MKIIFGLGNPGPQYELTRHNCGFLTLDEMADRMNIFFGKIVEDNDIAVGFWKGEKLMLAKPQQYMNLSGFPLTRLCHYYKVEYEDILVIQDDLDLQPGMIRLRRGGSDGGHNGIKSIIAQTGTNKINRLKIGIGAAAHHDTVDHVIGRFSQEEEPLFKQVFPAAADAAFCWLEQGIGEAMNRFNSWKAPLLLEAEEKARLAAEAEAQKKAERSE